MPNPLPEYECPPLNEVAIGVQFQPLKGFHAAHLGLYWSRIRDRYPGTEDQVPLLQQMEPEAPGPQHAVTLSLLNPASAPRCWFLDPAKNQLIQLQSDRFLRNWRQIQETGPYPRFNYLVGEFKREWESFVAFLTEQGIAMPSVNQCEVAYVNNIDPGTGWSDYSELGRVFSVLRPENKQRFLPTPELFSWETRYKLPENRGRLHVLMQPVFRGRDFKLVLSFSLTARGAPAGSTPEQLSGWFELAHEWIVRGFDELTEPAMHAIWKKKP